LVSPPLVLVSELEWHILNADTSLKDKEYQKIDQSKTVDVKFKTNQSENIINDFK
jgi:hypothetical protein